MSISEILLDKDSPLESCFDNWSSVYQVNPIAAQEDLLNTLFTFGGSSDIKILFTEDFPLNALKKLLSDPELTLNIVYNDLLFISKLSQFLDIVFLRCEELMGHEQFLQYSINVIDVLRNSRWDSFRLSGTIYGVKLASRILAFLYINDNNDDNNAPEKEEYCMALLHDLGKAVVYLNVAKDLCLQVRQVFFDELVTWSKKYASWCCQKDVLNCIRIGLHEVDDSNKQRAFMVLSHLLKSEDHEVLKHVIKLVKHHAVNIMHMIRSRNEEIAVLAIQVLHITHKHEAITNFLRPSCVKRISYHVYDSIPGVAFEAAKLIFDFYLDCTSEIRGLKFIDFAVLFLLNSPIDLPELFVDSMFLMIQKCAQWSQFLEYIKFCPFENCSMAVKLMYLFATQSVAPVKLSGRSTPVIKLSAQECSNNLRKFSFELGPCWVDLARMDNIKLQLEGLLYAVKIASLISFKALTNETIHDIVTELKSIHVSVDDNNIFSELVTLCEKKLLEVCSDPVKYEILDEFCKHITKYTFSDFKKNYDVFPFGDYCARSFIRMKIVVRHLVMNDTDESKVWQLAANKLREVHRLKLEEGVLCFLLIAVNLAFKKFEMCYKPSANESGSQNSLSDSLSSCWEILLVEKHNFIIPICIDILYHFPVSELTHQVFKILTTILLHHYGPLFESWVVNMNGHDQVLVKYVKNICLNYSVCSQTLEDSTVSRSSSPNEVLHVACCSYLKQFFTLVRSNIVKFECLADIVECLDRTKHCQIFVTWISNLLGKQQTEEAVATILYNGFVKIVNNEIGEGREVWDGISKPKEICKKLVGCFTASLKQSFHQVSFTLCTMIITYAFADGGNTLHLLDILCELKVLLTREAFHLLERLINQKISNNQSERALLCVTKLQPSFPGCSFQNTPATSGNPVS